MDLCLSAQPGQPSHWPQKSSLLPLAPSVSGVPEHQLTTGLKDGEELSSPKSAQLSFPPAPAWSCQFPGQREEGRVHQVEPRLPERLPEEPTQSAGMAYTAGLRYPWEGVIHSYATSPLLPFSSLGGWRSQQSSLQPGRNQSISHPPGSHGACLLFRC